MYDSLHIYQLCNIPKRGVEFDQEHLCWKPMQETIPGYK